MILADDLKVLYVGKASMNNTIGGRLGAYFAYDTEKRCRAKNEAWTRPPRFVTIIAVPEKSAFEAPALEEFLISELQPPDNTRGL